MTCTACGMTIGWDCACNEELNALMREPKVFSLAVNRCPIHPEFWAISVDDQSGGTRITSGKCCGRWTVVRAWKMTATQLRDAARVFEDAAEEADDE